MYNNTYIYYIYVTLGNWVVLNGYWWLVHHLLQPYVAYVAIYNPSGLDCYLPTSNTWEAPPSLIKHHLEIKQLRTMINWRYCWFIIPLPSSIYHQQKP